ncbi:uncharacterized protein LOC120353150 isoform X2 [Nilaparvata lugens]|uniref:uncharacterized protein LOC120353150 isoform X2 n=1 Tax=Nilaparvata lugens TaxID=108931 RepID=UPI00193E685B|nr:uncharacterized protein LOC120353150 isoform X2 [Nilaparvata lugens]
MNACDISRMLVLDMFISVFENCNQTSAYLPFKCPMKRFRCDMKDYVLNMRFNNLPAVPYGDYRVEFTVLKIQPYAIEERLSCLRFFGSTRPQLPANNKKRL